MSLASEEVAASPLCGHCNAEALAALSAESRKHPEMHWVAEVMVKEGCPRCDAARCCFTLPFAGEKYKVCQVVVPTQLVLDTQACCASTHGKNYNAKLGLARKIEERCNGGDLAVYQREIYGAVLSRASRHERVVVRSPYAFFPCCMDRVHTAGFKLRVKSTAASAKPEKSEGGGAKQPPPDEGSHDDGPDTIDQSADGDGLIQKTGCMPALSMKTFGDKRDATDRPAPQLCTLPTGVKVEHWASSDANVDAGVKKRYTDVVIEPTYPVEVARKLRKWAHELCKDAGPFSKAKILEFASGIGDMEDLQPKSWDKARWDRGYYEALQDTALRVSPGIAIKDEVLEDVGKNKPRFLVADGDKGQVAAKFVIKCFGKLWYRFRTGHHVKYMAKNEAMEMVMRAMKEDPKDGEALLEGDGAAWDACCNGRIRDDTENIILYHIADVLTEHPLFVKAVSDAHETLNTKDVLDLKTKGGKKVVINAIRRSGHAGTSDLNGFINAFLWAVVLTPEPLRYLAGHTVATHWHRKPDPCMVKAIDFFEGDDSLLRVPASLHQHEEAIQKKWLTFGFHMKLFFRINEPATFTGYDFSVENGTASGFSVPSIRRNIISSCFTVSTQARIGWRDGKVTDVHDVAENAFLARAVAFEHACPPLANAFVCLAEYHRERGSGSAMSAFMMEHKGVESTFADTCSRIRTSARPVSQEQEKFWSLSAGSEWGAKIPQLAALEKIDAYGAHFLDLVG